MPELPEVETIRQDLTRTIVGHTITAAEAYDDMILVNTNPDDFAQRLTDRTINDIARWGKVLIFWLSGDICLLVHLRMTGRLYTISDREALPEHTRAALSLDDGRRLVFVNPRRLGRLEIGSTTDLGSCRLLTNVGIDALSPEMDGRALAELLQSHQIAIKQFLLNQKYLAGIGNIYASEILFRCRLHPDCPANSLTAAEQRKLLRTMRQVLKEAIDYRGTTVSDYRDGEGKRGSYQSQLQVYGREGEFCCRAGCTGTIVRVKHAGRSTYLCPECQRLS